MDTRYVESVTFLPQNIAAWWVGAQQPMKLLSIARINLIFFNDIHGMVNPG